MAKIKIREKRFFQLDELIKMLDTQEFYNNLDGMDRNTKINNMLEFAYKNDPTTENIYKIAADIANNSLHDDYYLNEDITDLMKYIFDCAVSINYEIIK